MVAMVVVVVAIIIIKLVVLVINRPCLLYKAHEGVLQQARVRMDTTDPGVI